MASNDDKMDVDPPAISKPATKGLPKPRGGAMDKPKDRFKISKWNGVAMWAFDMEVDNCAICKHHVTELCMECMPNQDTIKPEDCVIAWGLCNHAFHFHCISHWLKKHNYCPLDNRQWEMQKLSKYEKV